MSLSKVGHKRLCGFSFSLCIIGPRGADFLVFKTLTEPYSKAYMGKE